MIDIHLLLVDKWLHANAHLWLLTLHLHPFLESTRRVVLRHHYDVALILSERFLEGLGVRTTVAYLTLLLRDVTLVDVEATSWDAMLFGAHGVVALVQADLTTWHILIHFFVQIFRKLWEVYLFLLIVLRWGLIWLVVLLERKCGLEGVLTIQGLIRCQVLLSYKEISFVSIVLYWVVVVPFVFGVFSFYGFWAAAAYGVFAWGFLKTGIGVELKCCIFKFGGLQGSWREPKMQFIFFIYRTIIIFWIYNATVQL